MTEDVFDEEEVVSPRDELPTPSDLSPPSDPPEVEPMISLNALTGFYSPHTLKLIGYINKWKVIILVDSGSTHNFIHCLNSQEVNCYIRSVNNFQIMISNGGSMKCGALSENLWLQIDQYHLKSNIFSIDMGGCDIVLSAKFLCTLDPILMDFKELTMQFQQEGQQYKFQCMSTGSPEIISFHRMEKLLKKGHSRIISKLHSIQTLRHHLCILASNLSSLDTKLFLPCSRNFPLLLASMIIPFLSY
jgi:hypothetical protein